MFGDHYQHLGGFLTLDIIAWHGRAKAEHKRLMDTYRPHGYRTLSLTVYDTKRVNEK